MWEPEKLVLFLLFFVPGFISMKVYQHFVSVERIDFSKSLYEAIGYSFMNFVFFSWLILLITQNGFSQNHTFYYWSIIFILVFITPVLWCLLYIWVSRRNFFLNRAIGKHYNIYINLIIKLSH